MSKSVTLSSGSKLDISLSPFEVSQNLSDAFAEELKAVKIEKKDDFSNLFKDSFCTVISSKRIREALNQCMAKAVYNGQRISSDTWEPEKARQDYWEVCLEVAKENLLPFGKSLYARFFPPWETMKDILASGLKNTPS